MNFSFVRQDIYEQILDHYFDKYGMAMPIDVWSAHLYLFPDFDNTIAMDPDLQVSHPPHRDDPSLCLPDDVMCFYEHDDVEQFETHLLRMRQWLKDQGHQDTPLIISEWSLLYPYGLQPDGSYFLTDEQGGTFNPDRVNAYMDATIDIMNQSNASIGNPNDNNRLVQQYMWFSYFVTQEFGETLGGSASILLDYDYQDKAVGDLSALTAMGLNYRQHALSTPNTVNLHVIDAEDATAVVDVDGKGNATLRVRFTNNGDYNVQTPFTVGFYSDSNLSQLIEGVEVTAIAQGCGVYEYEATIEWDDLSAGWHNYWVKVDAGNTIGETNEARADNVAQGRVYVGNNNIYTPLLKNGR